MSTSPFQPIAPLTSGGVAPLNMNLSTSLTESKPPSVSFASVLANALHTSNESSVAAGATTDGLVTGQIESTHEITIAGAKAEIMLHLTTQIASKLSSATTQLFQMQL